METIIEVCAGSYEDCLNAWKAGIGRVELNAALCTGGLTPSTATLKKVKETTDLEVICMVRPRAAGFCYSPLEAEVMLAEAEELLKAGADGIAFGFLQEDASVDQELTKKMTDLIHSYGKTAVFHRAVDVTADIDEALHTLIDLGVDRVLTSGQQEKADQAADLLSYLQKVYGDRIQILAGSGIHAGNAASLVKETGIHQVHSSCKAYKKDPTTCGKVVSFSCLEDPYAYDAVSLEAAVRLKKSLEQF